MRIRFYLVKRAFVFWWQRRTRGWDDSETWNLDFTFAKMLVPRLKRFKELNNGYPPYLTEKTWELLLDQMILAFEILSNEDRYDSAFYTDERKREVEAGLELFRQYYESLWW